MPVAARVGIRHACLAVELPDSQVPP